MASSGFSSLLWFIAILALIPAALWLLKRTPLGGAATGSAMKSVAVLPLSASQRVITVEVGHGENRRWLVLGIYLGFDPATVAWRAAIGALAAMMAVATGMATHVLCFRTLWEATFQQLMKEGKLSPPGGARTTSFQMPFGAMSAAHTLALNAQRHFHRYGTTRETLGWIAINQRANAALLDHPDALVREHVTWALSQGADAPLS